jgi:hypothetical protein
MYNDKAVYENGFFEDRTCKPEEMENCFNPLRCPELTALLEQPVEDDNVKAMLHRVRPLSPLPAPSVLPLPFRLLREPFLFVFLLCFPLLFEFL